MWRAVISPQCVKRRLSWRLFLYPYLTIGKQGIVLKRKNKFEANEVVILISTGEKVTINKSSYIANMKRYSYTIKENPNMFYFEDEMKTLL